MSIFLDEYDTAKFLFTQCVEAGGEYQHLVAPAIELISEILKNNTLPKPISDKTQDFVTSLVPEAVNAMLQLRRVSSEEIIQVMAFFDKVFTLIPWALSMKMTEPCLEMIKVIYKSHPFYNFNGVRYERNSDGTTSVAISTHYQQMMQAFLDKNPFDFYLSIISEIEPTVEQINYIVEVGSHIVDCFEVLPPLQSLLKSISIFFTSIKNMQLRNVDNRMLAKNMACIRQILKVFPETELANQYFQISEDFIRTDMLLIQLVGADSISDAIQVLPEAFIHWKHHTSIADVILKPTTHQDLLKRSQFLPQILNLENLQKLWNTRNTDKQALDIVKATLFMMDINDIRKFVEEIHLEKLDLDSLISIIHAIGSTGGFDEAHRIAVRKTLSVGTKEAAIKLNTLFMNNTESIKRLIFDELWKNFKAPINKALSAMLNMIFANENNLILMVCVYPELIEKISKGEVRDEGYDLLKLATEKINIKVNAGMIDTLINKEMGDDFFDFITFIIDWCNQKITEDALKRLLEIVESYNFRRATKSFAIFVYNLIILNEFLSEQLENADVYSQYIPGRIYNEYRFKRIPSCLHFLSDILMETEILEAASTAETQLQKILNEIKFEDSEKFIAIFLKSIIDKALREQLIRGLCFVDSYLKTAEMGLDPIDLGMPRHHYKQNDNSDINLCVAANNSTFYVTISKFVTGRQLANRIHFILGYPFIMYCHSIPINLSVTLARNSLKNDSLISINRSASQFQYPKTMLSVELARLNVTRMLLDGLKSDNSDILHHISSLLNQLPNDRKAIENLNESDENGLSKIDTSLNNHQLYYILQIIFTGALKLKDEECGTIIELFINDFPLGADEFITFFEGYFTDYFTKVIPNYAPQLSEKLFVKMEESVEYCEKSLLLLTKMSNITPTIISETASRHIGFIEKLIEKEINPKETNGFIKGLSDRGAIIELCLRRLTDIEFARLLSSLSSDITGALAINVFNNFIKYGHMNAALTLIKSNESLIEKVKALSHIILQKAFCLDCDSQEAAYEIALMLVDNPSEYTEETKEFINFKTKRFLLHPSAEKRNEHGVGIKNMGATCYMASVLQQMYHIPQFVESLIKNKIDTAGIPELQNLFCSIAVTKAKAVNPERFVRTWKGWHNNLIATGIQQDAIEFYQCLIDSLPDDISNRFKGSIENQIIADDKIISSNKEEFCSLQLDFGDKNDVISGINRISVADEISGYKYDGKEVDAIKKAEIVKWPEILVIQLNRFTYDLQTFERIKINKEFVYPPELDLGEKHYKLNGIVVHTGTAVGGHYTSVAKEGNKWVLFDDSEVLPITEENATTAYYGQLYSKDSEHNPSAYMLVYTSCENSNLGYSDLVDPELKKEIEKENMEMMRTQAAFSKETCEFISKVPGVQVDYFINIYCHSDINQPIAKFMWDVPNLAEELYQRKEELLNTLQLIPPGDTAQNVVIVVNYSLLKNSQSATDLAHFIADNLKSVIVPWRQAPLLLCPLNVYTSTHEDDNYVYDKIWEFLAEFFEAQRASTINKALNISDAFKALGHAKTLNIEILRDIAPKVMVSTEHSDAFLELCLSHDVNDPELKKVLGPKAEKVMMRLFLYNVFNNNGEKMNETIDSLQGSSDSLIHESIFQLYKAQIQNPQNRKILLSHPHELVKLMKSSRISRIYVESLIYLLFPEQVLPPYRSAEDSIDKMLSCNLDYQSNTKERKLTTVNTEDKEYLAGIQNELLNVIREIGDNIQSFVSKRNDRVVVWPFQSFARALHFTLLYTGKYDDVFDLLEKAFWSCISLNAISVERFSSASNFLYIMGYCDRSWSFEFAEKHINALIRTNAKIQNSKVFAMATNYLLLLPDEVILELLSTNAISVTINAVNRAEKVQSRNFVNFLVKHTEDKRALDALCMFFGPKLSSQVLSEISFAFKYVNKLLPIEDVQNIAKIVLDRISFTDFNKEQSIKMMGMIPYLKETNVKIVPDTKVMTTMNRLLDVEDLEYLFQTGRLFTLCDDPEIEIFLRSNMNTYNMIAALIGFLSYTPEQILDVVVNIDQQYQRSLYEALNFLDDSVKAEIIIDIFPLANIDIAENFLRSAVDAADDNAVIIMFLAIRDDEISRDGMRKLALITEEVKKKENKDILEFIHENLQVSNEELEEMDLVELVDVFNDD